MQELLNRLNILERKISSERGDFTLFALFLREDAQDKWDLVVAAPWLEPGSKEALSFLADQIQTEFDTSELTKLSRIAIIDQTNPALSAINNSIHAKHGMSEFRDCTFFGLHIKHAYIITSSKPSTDAPAVALA
jgi:hypothetical protein